MTNRRPLSWIRNVKSRLAQHVKDNTTEYTTTRIHYTNPIETYFSAQRDQVAKRAPFLVLPSCLLPASHATATVDPITATPLFVHRDAQSNNNAVVRAYVNQCRHRGARLIQHSKQPGFSTHPIRGSALVCPYHAWTYDVTTGDLKGVPGEKFGFPCLDKGKHGLLKSPVDCFESAGGIWLGRKNKDYASSAASSGWWPSMDSELSSLLPPPSSSTISQRNNDILVGYQEWHLDANWQLLVETFLESYHVKYLHKDTLGRVGHSNIMVTDVLDSHSLRMTVPLKYFDTNPPKLHNHDDDDEDVVDDNELESLLSQTTINYFLFPNTAISLFKRFILFLSIVPCSDSAMTSHDDDEENNQPSCKSHVRVWAIARNHHRSSSSSNDDNHHGGDDAAALARRDYESVIRGVDEDWECAEGIQSGLMAAIRSNNKSNTTFSHGCFEGNNVAFLNHVGLVSRELLLQDRRLQ